MRLLVLYRQGRLLLGGAYVSDDFLLVGTDDGGNGYTSQTSRLLLLDPATGELLDSWDNLNADIRSTVVYDDETDAYYFTSKGGTFYSVQVSGDRKLRSKWSVNLANGVGGVPMSTSTPWSMAASLPGRFRRGTVQFVLRSQHYGDRRHRKKDCLPCRYPGLPPDQRPADHGLRAGKRLRIRLFL